MAKGLLDFHNLLRWIILILLLISVVIAFTGWMSKRTFRPGDKRIWMFTLIFSHIMLVVGLYQWLAGRYGILTTTPPEDVKVMENKFYRFFWLEHPLFMITAIVLITLAYRISKKPLPSPTKYKRAFWLFAIALLMILLAIPWPFRDKIGRPLLPGGKGQAAEVREWKDRSPSATTFYQAL